MRARPLAIAGVMGGLESEVSADSTRILLESAYFEPMTVARTARRLGLRSEASYRFERGVDRAGQVTAISRAAELIRQMAGGRELAPVRVLRHTRDLTRRIDGELGGRGRGARAPVPPPLRADIVERLDRDGLLPAITLHLQPGRLRRRRVSSASQAGLRLTTPDERGRDPRGRRGPHRRDPGRGPRRCSATGSGSTGCERGVAAHHAGLLPVFKEIVEELFVRGPGARRCSRPRRSRSASTCRPAASCWSG